MERVFFCTLCCMQWGPTTSFGPRAPQSRNPALNVSAVLMALTEEPVKITLELKNVEGFESESATLTCDLSKSGRTDGQWLFNGQPLTTSERIQLKVDGYHQCVEFAELTLSDAGQYTYRIENVSTAATLSVRGAVRFDFCEAKT